MSLCEGDDSLTLFDAQKQKNRELFLLCASNSLNSSINTSSGSRHLFLSQLRLNLLSWASPPPTRPVSPHNYTPPLPADSPLCPLAKSNCFHSSEAKTFFSSKGPVSLHRTVSLYVPHSRNIQRLSIVQWMLSVFRSSHAVSVYKYYKSQVWEYIMYIHNRWFGELSRNVAQEREGRKPAPSRCESQLYPRW